MKSINKYLNNYGQAPIIEAIRRGETEQYKREQAEAREARNRHIKAIRIQTANLYEATPRPNPTEEQATEAIQAITGGEPTATATDFIKYLIFNKAEAEAEQEAQAGNQSRKRTGTIRPLSDKSFICLYNSKRLVYNGKTLRPKTHREDIILLFLKRKRPQVELTSNGRIKRELNQLRQLTFKTSEARTRQALKYILSFTGKADKATNTQVNELGKEKPVLSYNNIGYEPNEVIIIAEAPTLRSIKRQYEKLNKENHEQTEKQAEKQNQRKQEQEEEQEHEIKAIMKERPKREQEVFLNNLIKNSEYWEEQPIERKAELINRCLYFVQYLYKFQAGTQAENREQSRLRGLKRDEKEAIRQKNRRRNEAETEAKAILEAIAEAEQEAQAGTQEEAKELITQALREDGRKSILNIEYSIRKTSLLRVYPTARLRTLREEVREQAEPTGKGEQKKITALLNVITSYINTIHRKEEIRQEVEYLKTRTANELFYIIRALEEQEDTKRTAQAIEILTEMKEKREQQQEVTETIEEQENKENKAIQFKANKKSKSKYKTNTGLTRPNGNPQTTHRRTRNLKPLIIAKREVQAEKQAKEQQEQANERNRPTDLKQIQYGILWREQREAGTPTADRIRREAHRRNEQRKHEEAVYKSIYGELNTGREKQALKAELIADSFKTGLQIVKEESKKNIQRKYSRY
ncbi:MAG: hypothetical protein II598_02765 [Elusimicrobia bacterium]|nr:hypothetical protein [Elusimicrobiota bacterium]